MTIECPKCKHDHEPSGSHDDDHGETECQSCGFKFVVEIEYEPSYSTSCVEHEYGHVLTRHDRRGDPIECRFCLHCGRCKLET